jgi:DNA-binding response OmpR family regulator
VARVVVIEDEEPIAAAVAARLRSEGFEVDVAPDGPSGVALVERARPDLVVLDLMLPGFDGLEVCRRIQKDRPVPVLMLTARDSETDLLVGLAVGADDYLTKPFSPRELVARVRAVLRRSSASSGPSDRLAVGPLTADLRTRRVTVDGTAVDLTTTEFDLLTYLMRRPDRVCSREELLAEVWGYPAGTPTRTVDVHVAQLRAKLGDAVRLRTVRGVGYAVEPQDSRGTSASP